MSKINLFSLVFVVVSACAKPPEAPQAKEVAPAPGAAVDPAAQASMPPEVQTFGAPLTRAVEAVELAAVLQKADAYAGKTVLVEGHVRKACSRKGCWMELATAADAEAPGCRVTFKDYGFFVPLDSAGSMARLEGTIEVKTVPKKDVDHLESEGASFANKAADGTALEVKIVANGVEMWRAL